MDMMHAYRLEKRCQGHPALFFGLSVYVRIGLDFERLFCFEMKMRSQREIALCKL